MSTIDSDGRFVYKYKDDDPYEYFISQDLVSPLTEITKRDVTHFVEYDGITYYKISVPAQEAMNEICNRNRGIRKQQTFNKLQ